MFTGIVEEMGWVHRIEERGHPREEPGGPGRRFWIAARDVLADTRVSSSIAVSGVCLTVVGVEGGRFSVEAVPETLSRTTLGGLRVGDPVNLERPLTLEQRLGGHLVQGHVDGVGEVLSVVPEGDGQRVTIAIPPPLRRFVAEKGSLAVDGVSLTVARAESDRCEVALIPYTLQVTTSGAYARGTRVNLEVDLLARYLARLVDETGASGERP
ncbi:MAG TPA: riboflavin synthase [Terriglobales bacterium]|nr:riboflavin synthase [Terriglobales bacterium]